MDQKSWLWKKRSLEKSLEADKANNFLICHEEEEETEELLTEKARIQRDIRILNDKLCQCSSKDNIANKQVKITQEAIAGWEKAEPEAISSKKDFDRALQQKGAYEERLKECTQQLRFVQEEQERRVLGAVVKKSEEFEKIRIALDEKLAQASKKLVRLDAENARLTKALSVKDRAIEELSKYKAQLEADFNALMSRVESIEKENASLKYEVRVLGKELDIRNEEREFNVRTADVAQKQHQESVKKVARLESECQRLRLLVRKRLPGPAALTRMKNEVEMLGKGQVETRRRKSNPSLLSSMKQETLSDLGSDEKASTCAESWASALISELEHFKNEKQFGTPSRRSMVMGTPDLNLMDDFEEMEKLAVVSVDFPARSSHHSSEEGHGRTFCPLGSPPSLSKPKSNGEMVPVRIDDLLKIILEHSQELQRSPLQVLEDMKVALQHNTSDTAVFKGKGSTKKSLILDVSDTGNEDNISITKKIDQNVSVSIHKILELLEGINMISQDNCVAKSSRNENSATPTGYICRVFQWKSNQLSGVLQQFVQTCNDLLNGTADIGQFIRLVASTLDWVMNHSFSLQNVSSMDNAIRTHSDCNESRSESEVDSEPNAKEEAKRLNVHLKKKQSSVLVLGDGLQSQIVKGEGSMDIIDNLRKEMKATNIKQSKENTGDEIEKQKIMETNLEWSNDLENNNSNNNNSIKTLEETSNDLKILPKSKTSKGVADDGKPWENQLRSDWEITAASEKLAECQKTIVNLGKQLKALASPGNAAIFDKVVPTLADSIVSRRSSLLDNMLAEDNNQIDASPRTKDDNDDDDIQNGNTEPSDADRKAVISMAIVPRKRNGGMSLLKKLFWRKKRGNSKKTPFSSAA